MTMPRPHLSFSQLLVYARCPKQYQFKYLHSFIVDGANLPALVGSAFHAGAEEFERDRKFHFDSPQASAELIRLTRQSLTATMDVEGIAEDDLITFGKQDLKHWMGKGIPGLAKQYLAMREEESHNGTDLAWGMHTPPLEVKVTDNDAGGHPVIGFIDQVLVDSKDRPFIRDLKTGKPKHEHIMQLEVYRYLYQREFGVSPDYGQLAYVSPTNYTFEVIKFSLSSDAVADLLNDIEALVLHRVFPPLGTINGSCGQCDFRNVCPYGNVAGRGTS